jgi:hypothetical protein
MSSGCMDKISEKDEYDITHIVFQDPVNEIKQRMLELQNLLKIMPKTEIGIISYNIEKHPVRFNVFNFDNIEMGRLPDLDTIKRFKNLNEAQTRRFIQLVNYLDHNGLNGALVDEDAIMFNYHDSITVPTNWTDRFLIIKNGSKASQSWVEIRSLVDQTKDFALVEWD